MKKNSFSVKFLLIALCFSVTVVANAQKARFGIKGGFNLSTLSGYDDAIGFIKKMGESEDVKFDAVTNPIPRFHIGAISQIDLSSNFFLQPELLFSIQGCQLEYAISMMGSVHRSDDIAELYYLQLPVYCGYKFNLSQSVDLILGVGPYLAYGISDNEDGFKNGNLKRFDFGLSAMGGIQLNKFQITAGYDLGLTDMIDMNGWSTAKDMLGLSSICNRNFKASVAYLF